MSLFILQGLMMSIPGPTLLDLRHSSGTDAHSISFIFTARSIGYLIGSLIGNVFNFATSFLEKNLRLKQKIWRSLSQR